MELNKLNRSDFSLYLSNVITEYANHVPDHRREVSSLINDIDCIVNYAIMSYGDDKEAVANYNRYVKEYPELETILKGETNGKENKEN
jgi:hypothetical protein